MLCIVLTVIVHLMKKVCAVSLPSSVRFLGAKAPLGPQDVKVKVKMKVKVKVK